MTLDEAIKHAEEVAESCEIGNPKKISKAKCAGEHRQLAEWLKELKRLREQTKWVPISKRLPEEGEEVLVSAYDTYGKKVIIARYQGELYGFTCGLVSAWMPLPEPYKAEREGEE